MTHEASIEHHLTDELLTGYAAGVLPEAIDLAVATHISLCDDCRARLGACEAIGGAVLETTETCAMDTGALDAVLARISGTAPEAPALTSPRRGTSETILPAPLSDYVGGDVDAIRWRPLGGGVKHAVLDTGPGATARMLYIPAGAAVPEHGHHGLELTLVLQGAFRDQDGRFGRGDIEVADAGSDNHTPVAEDGEACICLAVTDALLKFTGLIPRMAQPFLGI